MKDFFEIEICIEELANEAKVLNKESRSKLISQLIVDVDSLTAAIENDEIDLIKTCIGFIGEKLIVVARASGTSFEECLNVAYNGK